MIKVIVSEDKHPILRSIVRKIEGYSPEISVLGEATDGISAFDLIRKLKPDIVFTDIRMPGMDGFQLIEAVKKDFPEMIFIIISGYDEFEYARQAMKLGVYEYLLKPVTQQAIDDTLDKVTPLVKSGRQAREIKAWNDVLNPRAIQCGSDAMELGYPFYFALLLCAGPCSNFKSSLPNPLGDFWSNVNLVSITTSAISPSDAAWFIDGQAINEQVVILGLSDCSSRNYHEIVHSILKGFSASEIPVTIVASKKVSQVQDMKLEFQYMRIRLKKYLIYGQSSIIYCDETKLNISTDSLLLHAFDEQKLTALLRTKNWNLFINEILHCMAFWERENFTQSMLEKCLKRILEICQKAGAGHDMPEIDIEMELDEVLSVSTNYLLLMQGLTYIFQSCFIGSADVSTNPESLKSTMEKVDNYLKEHFAENIFINELAEMFSFNVSYLSREFKKFKGLTPIDYLTQLRICKAKGLMLNTPDMKFKDIAEIVGYSNQYYFSKVFKLSTGLSPSEYKSSQKEVVVKHDK